jgi:hypothetical protein
VKKFLIIFALPGGALLLIGWWLWKKRTKPAPAPALTTTAGLPAGSEN